MWYWRRRVRSDKISIAAFNFCINKVAASRSCTAALSGCTPRAVCLQALMIAFFETFQSVKPRTLYKAMLRGGPIRTGRMVRARGGGGGGGPLRAWGLCGKAAGVGGGVTGGFGSQFSLSSSSGQRGNVALDARGDGIGVVLAESTRFSRMPGLGRLASGPMGMSAALASTKIVKFLLALRFVARVTARGEVGGVGRLVSG
jgi:hypothetical protein